MIDAYEIGISLALQDGVSAGLDVIMRELQALDAAVAASAAGLQSLMVQAQQAAVAARDRRPVQTAAVAGGESTGVPGTGPAAVARTPVAVEAPVAPDVQAANAAPAVAPRAEVAEAARSMAAGAPSGATPVAAAASMPTAPVAVAAAQPVGSAGTERLASEAVRPAPAAPPAPGQAPSQALGPAIGAAGRGGGSVVPPRGLAAMAPAAAPAAAARVDMSVLALAKSPEVRGMEAQRVPIIPPAIAAPVMAVPQAPRLPAAAPYAAMPSPAPVPDAPAFTGRPAAPPPPAGEGARGSGDVMLDGRLVGHWLADRMGRDAARPAAGTTGFDPRQSPAWSPAGTI